ncbi:MAG: type II secretion system F family protein, partial [Candidatus Eremiobacteraeota bacterium]|nr:type II secretion system F family protein [Candidatus Eremiobacteraeota bacterium]
SGSLARVLQELARYEEKRFGLLQKLRSQLVYPAFLLTASLLMAIVGPPYLLGNILELLNSYQVELSPLTRAIMMLSEASTNPFVWLFGIGTTLLLGLAARKLVRRSEVRLQLALLLSTVPYIGSVLQKLTLTRVASALALQLRSGTTLLKALEVSLSLSGNPVLQARSEDVQQALKDGETVVSALGYADYFPGYFLAMVEVGVASGNLDGSMAWLAEFCEQEFERNLEAMAAVIEPMMMLVMGIIVAVMLVGTMLPFVQLLQSL